MQSESASVISETFEFVVNAVGAGSFDPFFNAFKIKDKFLNANGS